jgi:hypothetical protein
LPTRLIFDDRTCHERRFAGSSAEVVRRCNSRASAATAALEAPQALSAVILDFVDGIDAASESGS